MNILIADDHELYRDALSILMQQIEPDSEITQCCNFNELLALANSDKQWDLILVDLSMPGLDYYDGIAQLSAHHPETPVIVITSSDNPEDARRAIEAGALGYISKGMKNEDMLDAIKLMLRNGMSIFPKQLATKASADLSALTPRQRDVLTCLCQGESNKRIALKLGLSQHTVKLHVRAILHALNVENRTQAVIKAKQLLNEERS